MSGDGASGRESRSDTFKRELRTLLKKYEECGTNLDEMSKIIEYEIAALDVAILKLERKAKQMTTREQQVRILDREFDPITQPKMTERGSK